VKERRVQKVVIQMMAAHQRGRSTAAAMQKNSREDRLPGELHAAVEEVQLAGAGGAVLLLLLLLVLGHVGAGAEQLLAAAEPPVQVAQHGAGAVACKAGALLLLAAALQRTH
jgi:hypothetical protein